MLKENDYVEEQGLNKTANNVSNSQEAIHLIDLCEDIIKTQNKKATGYNDKQGELSKKLKDTKNFFDNVSQSRSTILKFRFISF